MKLRVVSKTAASGKPGEGEGPGTGGDEDAAAGAGGLAGGCCLDFKKEV